MPAQIRDQGNCLVATLVAIATLLVAPSVAGADDNLEFQLIGQWNVAGSPTGIAVDSSTGKVFVAETYPDPSEDRIEYFNANGNAVGVIEGAFDAPQDVAVNPNSGRVFVADTYNNQIQYFDFDSNGIGYKSAGKWGSYGDSAGKFQLPEGVAVNPNNGRVYVADTINVRVQYFKLLLAGYVYLGEWNAFDTPPEDVAVDPTTNDIYTVEPIGGFAQHWEPGGDKLVAAWGSNDLDAPNNLVGSEGIAVDPATQQVFVAQSTDHRIGRYNTQGTRLHLHGSFGAGDGQFNTPWSVATNPNTGDIYVVDANNHRVERFRLAPEQIQSPSGDQGQGSGGNGANGANDTRSLTLTKIKCKKRRSKTSRQSPKMRCRFAGKTSPRATKTKVTLTYRYKGKIRRVKRRQLKVRGLRDTARGFKVRVTLPAQAKRIRARVTASFGSNSTISKSTRRR